MVEANRGTKKKTTTTATRGGAAASRGRGATSTRGGATVSASNRGTTSAARGRGAAASVSTGPRAMGAGRDDYECPVCLELCAQPVLTPCKHFMCFGCNQQVIQAGMTCPMCRAHFDKNFIPVVDNQLQREIEAAMGLEYEERKAQLEAAGDWVGNKVMLKFAFGNTHEDVVAPKPSKTNKQTKNSHRWCMFMSLNDSPELTAKYVKQVTYHLHPTFKPSKIVVSEAPFLLSRVGWGYFEIQMDIVFQPQTGLPPKRLTHELDFDDKGRTQSILLQVDQHAEDGSNTSEIAASLAAQIDKLQLGSSNDEERKQEANAADAGRQSNAEMVSSLQQQLERLNEADDPSTGRMRDALKKQIEQLRRQ